jgi:hypothetical protein
MLQEIEYRFDVAHVGGSAHISTLKPRSTKRFNIKKILRSVHIVYLCVLQDLKTNSDHFPI